MYIYFITITSLNNSHAHTSHYFAYWIAQTTVSYVEPVPPSLKKVKLNMGTSVDEADFKKRDVVSSQQHLSEHSFIINFRDGPGLKLCAESESDKFRWIKALRAAIESPKSWREFINTITKLWKRNLRTDLPMTLTIRSSNSCR